MATVVAEASIYQRIVIPEVKTSVGIGSDLHRYDHVYEFIRKYTSGVGANNVGAVFSGRQVVSGATPIDLSGSLTSVVDGTTVSFPLLMGVFLINYSTTPGEHILIGGGLNPITTIWGASGDIQRLDVGGFINLWNPIVGYAVTPATGDILNFAPGAGSPELGLLLVGRAS